MPIHHRYAYVVSVQADKECTWRFLGMLTHSDWYLPHAVRRRRLTNEPQRHIRSSMHHRCFPYNSMDGRFGRHHQQYIPTHLPLLGRHLIPALHSTLSADVRLLYVAHQDRAIHIQRDMAHSHLNNGMQHMHSMVKPAILR